MMDAKNSPPGGPSATSWNFKLLAQHELGGFGGMGEGMSIRSPRMAAASSGWRMRARRRISPASTSPTRAIRRSWCRRTCRSPICAPTRSNVRPTASWRSPIRPRKSGSSRRDWSCSTSRCPKNRSRSAFSTPPARIRAACISSGSATANTSTWRPARRISSRPIRSTTSSTAASTCAIRRKPVEVGRWWLPGTRRGDNVAPPPRHPLDKGYRAHNTNVYPQRPDRLYLTYIDGGMFIMDIADKSKPKPIASWTNSPPYTGFMHTVLPLFDRDLLVVTDESTEDGAVDWPKLIWLLDARDEKHPVLDRDLPHAAGRCLRQARRPVRRAQHP